jgi:hypothetical protein
MYTLLKTDALFETMESDYYEHCYTEQVLIRGRCAITNSPESVSQLINGYQFDVLSEFNTKEEAERARDTYIIHGKISIAESAPIIVEEVAIPKVEEPIIPTTPRIKLQRIMTDTKTDGMNVPWYGSNIKIVREKNEVNNEKESKS